MAKPTEYAVEWFNKLGDTECKEYFSKESDAIEAFQAKTEYTEVWLEEIYVVNRRRTREEK